ncbi:MAG: class I SAM-dependent methyltransferase [Candidatus Handelsmanbacteria bacterium]|nr:class I SAM-dependent methyltransferase [Candidatus Handelsmanbacteria bacterium]
MAESPDDPGLIAEQIDYYRARAGEYEEWYLRQGRYDHGPEWNGVFLAELEEVHQALRRFGPGCQVLELASGTGWWTGTLARTGAVTAVDASAETLAHNRRRHGEAGVRYVQANLFEWSPDRLYDAGFFWLLAVLRPAPPFRGVLGPGQVGAPPGGQVFFIDTLARDIQTLAAGNHHRQDQEVGVTVRCLNDGRSYRIIKVFYQPEELSRRLRELGWRVEVRETRHYFLYGSGSRAE